MGPVITVCVVEMTLGGKEGGGKSFYGCSAGGVGHEQPVGEVGIQRGLD